MKLSGRQYSTIGVLFRPYNQWYNFTVDEMLSFPECIQYLKWEDPDYIPVFGTNIGNNVYRVIFASEGSSARSTSTVMRELFSGRNVSDSNDTTYLASGGIIMDAHTVPLMFALRSTNRRLTKYDFRCVINTYVFRRENSFCKFILDTFVPVFMESKYRQSLFAPADDAKWSFSRLPKVEIVFKDMDYSFWTKPCKNAMLDEKKLAIFTSDFSKKIK